MRHIFIINDIAGGGRLTALLPSQIDGYFSQNGGNYKIEHTSRRGDATDIARKYASSGEPVRIYACGGDGTLHEVVNGMVGYPNAELGVFPCGTGNDYAATYGDKDVFLSVENQVKGSAVDVDLIETDGMYVINQCSMGFDASVADNVSKFKNKPFIKGKTAYLLSVFYTLFGKRGNRLTITIDDGESVTDEYLFAISAKGKYHGGGLMSAPEATPCSGNLNFMMVRSVPLLTFLTLFPKYIKGKHLSAKDIVTSAFGQKMRVVAQRPLPVTLDGEIIFTQVLETKVVPNAIKFILPAACAVKEDGKTKVNAAANAR